MGKKHKHSHGHYCRICGRYRANEKFSGGGHKNHICKDCARLPVEKRQELETVNRLMSLPFRLSNKQRAWLEKMRNDESDEVRGAAEFAYDMRFCSRFPESGCGDYESCGDEDFEDFEDYGEYATPELTTEELYRLFDE